jgi:protein involved in polysaccharide export with SLBB domain
MNGAVLRLVLVMLTAITIADVSAATNETGRSWPEVPLYPSTSLPGAKPVTTAKTNTIAPTSVATPANSENVASTSNSTTTNSGTSRRSWPAVPLSQSATSAPAVDLATLAAIETNHVKNSSAAKPTNSASADDENLDDSHVLEPGDQISFQILEDKQDPYTDRKDPINLTVTDSSEVDVPLVGRVSVQSKTCQQVAADVKVLLEKDYYYKATVVIGLNSINKVRGQAFICGLVRTQGPVDILFNHDLTASEAILMMGGLDDFADKKEVKIIRNHDEGGKTNQQIFVVNMQEVLEQGKIDKDVVLQPGDFVIVPARVLNF